MQAQPVSGEPVLLVPGNATTPLKKPLITPLRLFSLLFILFAFLTWKAPESIKRPLDFVFFLSLGLAGALFTFMWFGTDHDATHRNLNLLWANPFAFGALAGLWLKKQQYWLVLVGIGGVITVIGFPILPQSLHLAVVPIAGISILRTMDRTGYLKKILKSIPSK